MQAITTDGRTVNIVGVDAGVITFMAYEEEETWEFAALVDDNGGKYMLGYGHLKAVMYDWNDVLTNPYFDEDFNIISSDFNGTIEFLNISDSGLSAVTIPNVPLVLLVLRLIPPGTDNYGFFRSVNGYWFNQGSWALFNFFPNEGDEFGLITCVDGHLFFKGDRTVALVSDINRYLVNCDYSVSSYPIDETVFPIQTPIGYGNATPSEPPFVYNAIVLRFFFGFPADRFPWMNF